MAEAVIIALTRTKARSSRNRPEGLIRETYNNNNIGQLIIKQNPEESRITVSTG
jgi:hypothetical protein